MCLYAHTCTELWKSWVNLQSNNHISTPLLLKTELSGRKNVTLILTLCVKQCNYSLVSRPLSIFLHGSKLLTICMAFTGVEPRTPLTHDSRTTINPHNMYCKVTQNTLSHTWQLQFRLGLTRKFSPSGNNCYWVVFVTLNAQSILPYGGKQ